MEVGDSIIKRGRIEIPLRILTLPLFSACTEAASSYFAVSFMFKGSNSFGKY